MRSQWKRYIAVFLSLVITATLVPKGVTAFAVGETGEKPIAALDAYYQAGDAVLEGEQYVLAPEHNYTLGNTQADLRSSVTYGVHFSLSGQEDYVPGSVVLRIPAKIFIGRDGTYAANIETVLPVPEEGASGAADYAYRYDAETDEYIITNVHKLSSACEATFNIRYVLWAPSLVVGGSFTRDYDVSLTVSREDAIIDAAEASAGNIRIDTRFSIKESKKEVYRKYESYPSGWGMPTDADADRDGDGLSDECFYVVYRILTQLPNTNTQPAVLKVEDFPEAGEVVAYRSGRDCSNSMSSADLADPYGESSTEPPEYAITEPACYVENYYATFVLVRYRRADLVPNDSGEYKLRDTAVSTLTGEDTQEPVTKEASMSYTYVPPKKFQIPGNYATVEKSGSGVTNGAVNALQAGHDVTPNGEFTNTASVSYYEKTYLEPEGLTDEAEIALAKQNPDNYGKRNVRTELIDDLFYFQDHYTDAFTAEDYELTNFSIMNSGKYAGFYRYAYNAETGDYQSEKLTGNDIPDMELWVKSGNGDVWEKLGTYHMNGYMHFLYEDGTDVNANRSIALPANTSGVKLVIESACLSAKITYKVGIKLHSTEHIRNLIDDTTPQTTIYGNYPVDSYSVMNVNTLLVYDADGNLLPSSGKPYQTKPEYLVGAYERDRNLYGMEVGHATATTEITDFVRDSTMTKKLSSYKNDTSGKEVRLHYELQMSESIAYASNTFTAEEIGNLGFLNEQRTGTFYDLLPMGCELDTSSLKVTPYLPSGSSQNAYLAAMDTYSVSFSYELEENWHDTGRTMLTIHMETPEGVRTYPYKNGYAYQPFSNGDQILSGFIATFDLVYPWDAVSDYGTTLLNSAAYRAENGKLTSGYPDNGGKLKEKNLFYDLDGDGNPEGISSNYLYGEAETKLNVVTATELDLSKRVRAENGTWTDGQDGSVVLEAGSAYEYRLRVGSAKNTRTKDIVFFDALEQYHPENGGEQWRGILTGVDTSQLRLKGAFPVIYYSTSEIFSDPAQLEIPENRDLTNDVLWTTVYPEENPAAITAIAIDLRTGSDGGEFVLQEQQTVNVILKMKVPDDITESALKNAHAYNNVYLSNTLIDTQDTETSFVIHAEYTQVWLRMIEDSYELPNTGGSGTLPFYVCGIFLVFVAVIYKEKKRTVCNTKEGKQ